MISLVKLIFPSHDIIRIFSITPRELETQSHSNIRLLSNADTVDKGRMKFLRGNGPAFVDTDSPLSGGVRTHRDAAIHIRY